MMSLNHFFRSLDNYARLGNVGSSVHTHFAGKYRPQRMRRMQSYFDIRRNTTVLDIGGSPWDWQYLHEIPKITIINVDSKQEGLPEGFRYVCGDARHLPFSDKSFDICFSNSVIEHVGGWEDQKRMASEIQRVGRSYYLQTPNYHFFIEPHFIAPFIHWLPAEMRRRLARYFTLWGLTMKPTPKEIDEVVEQTKLLTRRQMKDLFPGAHWLPEKVMGMDKSLIVVGDTIQR